MYSPLTPDWYTGDEDRDELRLRIWFALSKLSDKQADSIITWMELSHKLGQTPTFPELAAERGLTAQSSAHGTFVAALANLEDLLRQDPVVRNRLKLDRR